MKTNLFTRVLITMVCVLAFGCATQQERQQRQAQVRAAVQEAVAKRNLCIEINTMDTQRYGTRHVTPDFFLKLRGDTLQSYLPYLGQAYQAPMMSPSQGLNFEEPYSNYVERHPKSDLSVLELSVRTREDLYHYVIEVYTSGRAFIYVRSQHRDPISFSGECAF